MYWHHPSIIRLLSNVHFLARYKFKHFYVATEDSDVDCILAEVVDRSLIKLVAVEETVDHLLTEEEEDNVMMVEIKSMASLTFLDGLPDEEGCFLLY